MKTIYLDRVRLRNELLWEAYVDGERIASDVELEDCKRAARRYVEEVLLTEVNAIVRVA